MIQANELRIGNWIMAAGTGELHPVQITIDNLRQLVFSHENGAPIPLTPEILEKCGFILVQKGFYTFKNIVSFAVFNGILSTTYVLLDNIIKPVRHLHQLQNLYFALTGEELKIDL